MVKNNYSYEIDENGVIHIPPELKKEKAEKHEIVYLSDFMNRLPENCFFLKGVTGNGATTLAMSDYDNCVIALPTRNTVQSKWVLRNPETHEIEGDNKNLLCIYGGLNDTIHDLRQYLESRPLDSNKVRSSVKIVCTYDQVGRVLENLRALGANTKKYRLYIDEIHEVLKDSTNESRRSAINAMMKAIPSFQSVTCITATPYPPEYNDFYEETANLPTIRMDYEEIKWNPEEIPTEDIVGETHKIVMEHLEDKRFGNAHIFLNSVVSISNILKRIDMDKYGSNIRVICGDTDKNKDRIRRALVKNLSFPEYKDTENINLSRLIDEKVLEVLGKEVKEYKGIALSSINSQCKKVNFYTKTAWQGADVYDKEGQVYVVSDGTQKHTMADPSTDLKQILGRIRDSRNLHYVRIYRPADDRYKDALDSQYKKDKEERTPERVKRVQENFKATLEDNPKIKDDDVLDVYKSRWYLRFNPETGELEEDKCLKYLDEINYTVRHSYYAIPSAYIVANFEAKKEREETISEKLKKNEKARKGITFKSAWKEWIKRKEGYGNQLSLFPLEDYRQQELEAKYPLLPDAYKYLKREGVEALGCNQRKVASRVATEKALVERERIYQQLEVYGVKPGARFYGSELTNICKKVTLLNHYPKPIKYAALFEFKTTTRRIDGKQEGGVVLLRRKTNANVIKPY